MAKLMTVRVTLCQVSSLPVSRATIVVVEAEPIIMKCRSSTQQ